MFEEDLRMLALLFIGGVGELVLKALAVLYSPRSLRFCLDVVSGGPPNLCGL